MEAKIMLRVGDLQCSSAMLWGFSFVKLNNDVPI